MQNVKPFARPHTHTPIHVYSVCACVCKACTGGSCCSFVLQRRLWCIINPIVIVAICNCGLSFVTAQQQHYYEIIYQWTAAHECRTSVNIVVSLKKKYNTNTHTNAGKKNGKERRANERMRVMESERGGNYTQIVAYCATVVVVYIAKCAMCNGKQKINTIESGSLSGTVGTMHIQVDTSSGLNLWGKNNQYILAMYTFENKCICMYKCTYELHTYVSSYVHMYEHTLEKVSLMRFVKNNHQIN